MFNKHISSCWRIGLTYEFLLTLAFATLTYNLSNTFNYPFLLGPCARFLHVGGYETKLCFLKPIVFIFIFKYLFKCLL